MKNKIKEILENYPELDVQKKTKLADELHGVFMNLIGDGLPQEFYDKFVKRQVDDCGGQVLDNIEAQYNYARGFGATLEIMKEVYGEPIPTYCWKCSNDIFDENNRLLFVKDKLYWEQDDRGESEDIAICLCDEFGAKRYLVDEFVRNNFNEI